MEDRAVGDVRHWRVREFPTMLNAKGGFGRADLRKVMMNMRRRSGRFATMLIFPVALLAACSDDDSDPSDTSTPVGIANPASVYCVEQGGTVDIVDEAGGQVGYCNLPDGTRVEEWEYFEAQTGTTQP